MAQATYTEFQSKMKKYFDSIETNGEELIVTRRGHQPLVILPHAYLRGLRETLHLVSSPANAARRLHAIEELDQGRGTERPLIER